MLRAAVLIGVSTTGGLPNLQAVESGIAQMAAWAEGQGIRGDRLVVLTDKDEIVRVHQISDAIAKLVKRRDLDQLIVYFSGHGVHNRGDLWLLSEAPGMPYEAVNVEGSIQLARYCGIGHVVFIADVCRTAAGGIQGLGVTGTEIFPNEPVDGMERAVDSFFACARGKPALEVQDAGAFSALYTEVLAECLAGQHPAVLERGKDDGAEVDFVTAWKLADELLSAVPTRLRAKLNRIPSVNQTPVARICSRNGWISRVPPSLQSRKFDMPVDVLDGEDEPYLNAVEVGDRLLEEALSEAAGLDEGLLGDAYADGSSGDAMLRSAAGHLAGSHRAVADVVTGCGFRLRGARIRALHCVRATGTILNGAKATLASIALEGEAENVLIELDDGGGVLMPAIPDFITELTFEEGELAHVAFVPVPSSRRWARYEPGERRIRALRAAIGAAAGMGVFRMTEANEEVVARAMVVGGSVDPSITLYAAYAYHEMGRREDIADLEERLQAEMGFAFFDIAMLCGGALLRAAPPSESGWPSVPLLSRGWSLRNAFRVQVEPQWHDLHLHLRPSLWTLFNASATKRLINAVQKGGIQK